MEEVIEKSYTLNLIAKHQESIDIKNIGYWLEEEWSILIKNVVEIENGFQFSIDEHVYTVVNSERTINQAYYNMAVLNNYSWTNIFNEKDNYNNEIILSVTAENTQSLAFFKELTSVVNCLFRCFDFAFAVYNPQCIMIVDRNTYFDRAVLLKEEFLPIELWIYIGLGMNDDDTHFGFTYGFHQFGKKELEINKTNLSIEDLYSFSSNISAYILIYDIALKHGHTLVYEEKSIPVKLISSRFHEGEAFELIVD
jgi:hypothetical protein